MEKSRVVSLVVAFIAGLLIVTAVAAQSGGSHDVEWQVLASAGEQFVSGGSHQMGFTLGQDTPSLVSQGGSHQVVQGYWSGAGFPPTAVTLVGFWVEPRGDSLVAYWETAAEVDLVGFYLYRSDTGAPGSFVRLNEGLIPCQAPGSPAGVSYEWVDVGVEVGQTYFYLLEDLDIHGEVTRHGPVPATLQPTTLYRIYLPLVRR